MSVPGKTSSIDEWTGRVHCGDCIELMSQMPAESVGVIVTSPPYNLRMSSGNGMWDGRGGLWQSAQLLKEGGYDKTRKAGTGSSDDAMPYEEYVKWQRDGLNAMSRVLRQDGAIFYNHKWRVQNGELQDRHSIVTGLESGLVVRQIIIWQRAGGMNFNAGYFVPTYEVVYFMCKSKSFKLARIGSKGAGVIGDVWKINQERNNKHPAPFPVELAKRCIESTSAKIVLDPFIGSGTTAIAAEILGREWIGMDISKTYCEQATQRIKAARI